MSSSGLHDGFEPATPPASSPVGDAIWVGLGTTTIRPGIGCRIVPPGLSRGVELKPVDGSPLVTVRGTARVAAGDAILGVPGAVLLPWGVGPARETVLAPSRSAVDPGGSEALTGEVDMSIGLTGPNAGAQGAGSRTPYLVTLPVWPDPLWTVVGFRT